MRRHTRGLTHKVREKMEHLSDAVMAEIYHSIDTRRVSALGVQWRDFVIELKIRGFFDADFEDGKDGYWDGD